MSKKQFLYLFIILFLIFFILGTATVGKNTDPFSQFLKSLLPDKTKVFLKKTVFAIPTLFQQNAEQSLKIKKLSKDIGFLKSELLKLTDTMPKTQTKEIISKDKKKYELTYYKLNLPSHYDWGLKPVAYIEQTKDYIYLTSGNGNFIKLRKNQIGTNKLNYETIKTNIENLISDEQFYDSYVLSIKDLFIKENKIYFSFGNLKDECFYIKIFRSDLNQETFKFEKFFEHKECKKDRTGMNFQHIGGRIVSFKDNKILLSVGDFGDITTSQNKDSIFGKIISIDLANNNFEIISTGSRNAQGLYYDKSNDVILNTEHGPTGGDEVNVNVSPSTDFIENFGWPNASYAFSANQITGKEFGIIDPPGSHKKFGFVEPVKYFTPSIGISEIIKVSKEFNSEARNDFFVNALGFEEQIAEGDQSIHHIRLSDDYSKVEYEDVIQLKERIRDIIYLADYNSYLLVLETVPALGLLKLKK
tara:strand:- start:505 stop:1923 length:1419 start_codon:yes stop_codon:yes gene_type:complete